MNLRAILSSTAGWGMTVVRIPVGVIFMAHGLPKFGITGEGRNLSTTAEFLDKQLGLPMPDLMAILVASAETIGGALIILGLLTRPAALTTAIAMAVATFMFHWPNGLTGPGGYEWTMLLMCASIALVIDGAGKLSLDNLLKDRF